MIQAVDTNSHDSTEKLGIGKLSEIFLKEILAVKILKMRQRIAFGKNARKMFSSDLDPSTKIKRYESR